MLSSCIKIEAVEIIENLFNHKFFKTSILIFRILVHSYSYVPSNIKHSKISALFILFT